MRTHWAKIKEEFGKYTNNFLVICSRLSSSKFEKSMDDSCVETARSAYMLVKEGLSLVSSWNGVISRAMSWKFTHPCSEEYLREAGVDMTSTSIEYERLVKYNFSNAELNMFVDVVAMIKSLAALLESVSHTHCISGS